VAVMALSTSALGNLPAGFAGVKCQLFKLAPQQLTTIPIKSTAVHSRKASCFRAYHQPLSMFETPGSCAFPRHCARSIAGLKVKNKAFLNGGRSPLFAEQNTGSVGRLLRRRRLRVTVAQANATNAEARSHDTIAIDGTTGLSAVGAGNGSPQDESPFAFSETDGASPSEQMPGASKYGGAGFPDEVVEVSVLDDSPNSRSAEELAKELEAMGIEVGPDFSEKGFRVPDKQGSSAEKLAAIMAKNGLDPSEFTQQYEEAMARDLAERERRGQLSSGQDLLEQYGEVDSMERRRQWGRGSGNRALVALDDALQRGSR
jgi:hypothetical protein